MAKTVSELNRKVLQNIRTTKDDATISSGLTNILAVGEIAVQIGVDSDTAVTEEKTGLWVLAGDASNPTQAVRIPSEQWVKNQIQHGASDAVDNIIDAVGLQEDGSIVSGDSSSWGDSTNYFNSAVTVVDAVKALDSNLAELSGYVAESDYELAHDDNKVVDSLKQVDGRISGTSVNLSSVKLAGYEEPQGTNADNTVSDVKVAATNTLGEALAKLQKQVNSMDKNSDVVDGKVVTTVIEADGIVTETKANVKDLQLGGYSKDTTKTGAIESADTINTALSKLENQIGANTITNADGSINVTTGATTDATTDINVNIKSGEHVLAKDGNAGLYTDIKLSGVTPSSDVVKEEYVLYGTDGSQLGESIKIYKDSHIVSIDYVSSSQTLEYKYIDASGNTQTTDIDLEQLLIEGEFQSGVGITDHIVHGVVDPSSEIDENSNPFLTVGGAGFKVDGIKDAIDTKINKLDVSGDTAVAGQYVAAIEETDGIVAVKTRANVSEAVLNNYAKGSDATAVAATDTVNQAISKLENQVDAAKAAATTKVVEGTDNDHLVITSAISPSDSSVTYTIELTDVASESALTELSGSVIDEIARAKSAETAIGGAVGLTKGANDESRTWDAAGDYLTGSTVKADMEILDDIIGVHTGETVSAYNVTFSDQNSVAKNISDIRKDLDAFKSGLTLTAVDDDKYIATQVTTAATGTTLGVSAITKTIASSTSGGTASESALVDSWDAKAYALTDRKQNDGTNSGVDSNIKTIAATNDAGKMLDFSELVVDCGTF